MKRILAAIVLAWGLVPMQAVYSQAPVAETDPAEQADRDQLRVLRESLTKAVIAGDVDAQLALADDRLVTTWQNGAVARGKQGVRDFITQMEGDGERVFRGYKSPPTPDDTTQIIGGDTAIASGTSTPHYKWMGMEFDLENRWTATLVKEGGEWKLAAYHVSANIFDNPLLSAAKSSNAWSGFGGLLVGLIGGWLGSRMLCKPRQ